MFSWEEIIGFYDFPAWSDGDYGLDSTATTYTTLGISEENKQIEEEEEDSDYTYLKKITIMVCK